MARWQHADVAAGGSKEHKEHNKATTKEEASAAAGTDVDGPREDDSDEFSLVLELEQSCPFYFAAHSDMQSILGLLSAAAAPTEAQGSGMLLGPGQQ